jgi:hypothetical protein
LIWISENALFAFGVFSLVLHAIQALAFGFMLRDMARLVRETAQQSLDVQERRVMEGDNNA